MFSLPLLCLFFAKLSSCTNFTFRPIDVDEDLSGDDFDFSGTSSEPFRVLDLSENIQASMNPFTMQDVGYIFDNFTPAPVTIPVDTSDTFLISRMLASTDTGSAFSKVFGVYENFAGRRVAFVFPFRGSPVPEPAELVDYEVLYAEPQTLEIIPPAFQVLTTPPASPERQRKRKLVPDSPMSFANATKRRCRAALNAFRRNIPETSVHLSSLERQFNNVLYELSLPPFSAKEFRGFEENFEGQFLRLVQRCPEEYLVSSMLYALMSEDTLPNFIRIYETEVNYWQRHSRSFAIELIKGVLLLPRASNAALNHFRTQKNPFFFFNHESDFDFLIGCFHYEDVIQAIADTAPLENFGQNSIAAWLLSETQLIEFNNSSNPRSFKGFLPFLHRSRVLFESDDAHMAYIRNFFNSGLAALSHYPKMLSAFLSAFIKSKMILKLLDQALRDDDRGLIVAIMAVVKLESNIIGIRNSAHEILSFAPDGDFLIEIKNLDTHRITRYQIL